MRYIIVNFSKKQYLLPGTYGDRPYLTKNGFPYQGSGVMTALAVLLAKDPFESLSFYPLSGTWSGDKIAIVSEDDAPGKHGIEQRSTKVPPYETMRDYVRHKFQEVHLLAGVSGIGFSGGSGW